MLIKVNKKSTMLFEKKKIEWSQNAKWKELAVIDGQYKKRKTYIIIDSE